MWEIAGTSVCGPIRKHNEDAIGFDARIGAVVLADGMGGYAAGEVASAIVVEQVLGLFQRRHQEAPSSDAVELLRRIGAATRAANAAILDAVDHNPDYEGMGSTLVAVLLTDEQACIGHVGDSRAYVVRDGRLVQLTRDHTVLQEQIDAGIPEDQIIHPANGRSPLTRGMGVEDEVEAEMVVHALEPGDLLLVASDGLFEPVPKADIERLLQSGGTLAECSALLAQAAIDAGGRDNISVVLAQRQSSPPGRIAALQQRVHKALVKLLPN